MEKTVEGQTGLAPASAEQPPQYTQPSPQYSHLPVQHAQPPPLYVQQPNVQAYPNVPIQYTQQPVYQQAGGQTVILVNQPTMPERTDWTFPGAKVPGILLIISGCLNLICFVTFGFIKVLYAEFAIACLLYIVTGTLGVVGALKQQTSKGCSIACVVMASVSVIMAFAQIINRGIVVGLTQALSYHYGGYWGDINRAVLWVSVALLVIAFGAMALSIALIVIPSKLLCSCCGATPLQSPGFIIPRAGVTQVPTQQMQVIPTVTQ